MANLAAFLERLFDEGRVAFRSPPTGAGPDDDRASASEILRRAFAEDLMELAGPPVPLDEPTALAAAAWTRLACWFLVSRGEPDEDLERALPVPPDPSSAAQHLAADLTFRYLPAVHRRARAIDADDPLSRRLAEVLRRWPLSGALADLDDGPIHPIDFDEHEGIALRYAERLAEHPRDPWIPPPGRSRDLLAIALDALGRRHPIVSEAEATTFGQTQGTETDAVGGAVRGPA